MQRELFSAAQIVEQRMSQRDTTNAFGASQPGSSSQNKSPYMSPQKDEKKDPKNAIGALVSASLVTALHPGISGQNKDEKEDPKKSNWLGGKKK